MHRIGVLGGTGEIGSRILNLLKGEYSLMASYYSQARPSAAGCEYVKLDIADAEQLQHFCRQCDVLINCAGASFLNGEKVARMAADWQVPYIDPSGEAFLEERLADRKDEAVFVLSAGYFPGMSGLLMRHVCQSFDTPETISGLSVSEEIPSMSAIEDFILTNLSGFGTALSYYDQGAVVRDEGERMERIRDREFRFQNYLTVETARVAQHYGLQEAHWYHSSFGDQVIRKLQEAVIQYKLGRAGYKSIVREVIEIFRQTMAGREPFSYTRIEGQGLLGKERTLMRAEVSSPCSSEISAIIAAYAAKAVLAKPLRPGIYYAMDIINMEEILKDLAELKAEIRISKVVLEQEVDDEYEEGEL